MSKRNQGLAKNTKSIEQQKWIARILTFLIVLCAMLIPLFIAQYPQSDIRSFLTRYQIGELANEDVFATSTFQYEDEKRTARLIQEASDKVLPYFSYSLHATSLSVSQIQRFISFWKLDDNERTNSLHFLMESQLADPANVMGRFFELDNEDLHFMLLVLEETSELVLQKGLFSENDIQKNLSLGYENYYLDNNITMEKTNSLVRQPFTSALTKDTLSHYLSFWIKGYQADNPSFQPMLLFDTLQLLLLDNVVYNEARTMQLRTLAAENIKSQKITIRRGQKIISKDSVITAEQVSLLKIMSESSARYTILELIGSFFFICMATGSGLFLFIQFIKDNKRLYQYLNLMLSSLLLTQVAVFFVFMIMLEHNIPFKDSFLPLLFAPIFVSHITSKKRLGLISGFMLSCYAMMIPQSTAMTFFFSMTAIGCCLYFFQYTIKRLEDLFNWFYACVVSSFIAISLNLVSGISFGGVVPLIGALIINITLSIVFVDALVPLCERLFNIPTSYRLTELAFADSPVLDRLSTVAQGTYNHSRYVSELAYNAARAIGANALLARVGGIFHDIGKADHPEYFVENQGLENKHDDIKPSLSAAIIKSHVKLGLEKGREAGLPQEVLDIIAQHHGNDVIQFFYNEAKDQALAAGREVNIDDYCYNGEPPTTAEAAIVMLSDCVEAASRTLKKPTPSKYEKLIHSVIMGKIERDQLKDSNLSLTELDSIGGSFLQTLIGRDHHRIEYPDEIQDGPPNKSTKTFRENI
ncbi:MAG: HDIG domain-containing protein [Sphaerochaeta sp.]|nr:HDIG domain-containing protein [Sphaerochaeta sp.]